MQLFGREMTLPPPVDPTTIKVAIDTNTPLEALGVHVSCLASPVPDMFGRYSICVHILCMRMLELV